MAKIAARIPPKVAVNPYAALSDAALLEMTKSIVENTAYPVTAAERVLLEKAKNILRNNGINFTDNEVKE